MKRFNYFWRVQVNLHSVINNFLVYSDCDVKSARRDVWNAPSDSAIINQRSCHCKGLVWVHLCVFFKFMLWYLSSIYQFYVDKHFFQSLFSSFKDGGFWLLFSFLSLEENSIIEMWLNWIDDNSSSLPFWNIVFQNIHRAVLNYHYLQRNNGSCLCPALIHIF